MPRCDCPPYDCPGRRSEYLAGDQEAGLDLLRKFDPLIRAIVARVLGDGLRNDWPDAGQVIHWHILQKLDRYVAKGPFCRWLERVAVYQAIDFKHAAMSDPLPTGGYGHDVRTREIPLDVRECIETVYSKLPEEMRRIFDLTAQGLGREAVAGEIGRSPRTIQYRLEAIRGLLMPCVEE